MPHRSFESTRSSCALCRQSLQTPILRESELWRVFLNRNQNLLGKAIVSLRRHVEDVTRLSAAEWDSLRVEVAWTTERLRHAFSPDHFNYAFLQNQDRHVHLHVIPRYAGPRRIGEVEFSDPDYPGHYRVPGPENVVGPDVQAAIARRLSARR